MPPPKFQRARKPEEKEIRRQAILEAARRLMDEVGAADLSLNELARRAGVSKPNVYRYFESREEVLLHLWTDETRVLVERLEASLPKVPVGDIARTAAAIVAAYAAQPRLCELSSILAAVLERNLSADALVAAKRTVLDLFIRIGTLLHEKLPSIPVDDCMWASRAIGTYLAGIWPATNPGAVADEVLARPEFARLKPDLERDFKRLIEVLIVGLERANADLRR